MTTLPLISLAPIATSTDIRIEDAGFAATTATLVAIYDAGKAFFSEVFGVGAISAELPKSKAIDFAVFASRKGITVE